MITKLWEECSINLDIPILKDIDWKEVHIGFEENTEDKQMINHVVLLVKYLIFLNREKGKPPSIVEIEEKLFKNQQEEKRVSIERNRLTVHYKKWEHLKVNQTN